MKVYGPIHWLQMGPVYLETGGYDRFQVDVKAHGLRMLLFGRKPFLLWHRVYS